MVSWACATLSLLLGRDVIKYLDLHVGPVGLFTDSGVHLMSLEIHDGHLTVSHHIRVWSDAAHQQ